MTSYTSDSRWESRGEEGGRGGRAGEKDEAGTEEQGRRRRPGKDRRQFKLLFLVSSQMRMI